MDAAISYPIFRGRKATIAEKAVCSQLDIRFLDHLIYSCSKPGRPEEWLSMRESGLL